MDRIVKIAVSIPTEGVTTPESYDNRLLFAFHLGKLETKYPDKFQFFWDTAGSMLTPAAREKLAVDAVRNDCDLIMMIDDDMLIPYNLFEMLYKRMEDNKNIDIIAPLAFTRNPPHLPVIYTIEDGYDSVKKAPYFKTKYVRNYPKGKVVECDAVGFGAVLIRTDVLKKMKPPYFMSTSPTGEDILFCVNAKKTGARIFMDTSFNIIHLGNPIRIDEEYAQNYWEKSGENINRLYGVYRKYDDC